MPKTLFFLRTIAFAFISMTLISCEKEEEPITTCSTEVLYKGTAVCNQGENAAAISFVNTPNDFIILTNFFEFIDEENIDFDDAFQIDYENIDSSLLNSGILCGPLIVAPIADLTCLEKL